MQLSTIGTATERLPSLHRYVRSTQFARLPLSHALVVLAQCLEERIQGEELSALLEVRRLANEATEGAKVRKAYCNSVTGG